MDEEKEQKKEEISILKKKIKYLEEELVRRQDIIETLKHENLILFRTALKRTEDKINLRENRRNHDKDNEEKA
jgi:hypothetical protein